MQNSNRLSYRMVLVSIQFNKWLGYGYEILYTLLIIRFVNRHDFCNFKLIRKNILVIDKFTKYVSGSMYVSIHCFKINAAMSSFPGAEFLNVLITVMILLYI